VHEAAVAKWSAVDNLVKIGRYMAAISSTNRAKKLLKMIQDITDSYTEMEAGFQLKVKELKNLLLVANVNVSVVLLF
jgi:hypothetical protein